MFHMPLFYIISGYCHSWGKYKSWSFGRFALSVVKSYLIPYIIFSILGLIISLSFPMVYFKVPSVSMEDIKRFVMGILIARGNQIYTGEWGAVWFLVSLVWIMLLAFISDKIRKPMVTALLAFALLYINETYKGYFCFTSPVWIPLNLGAACVGFPLFCVGMLIRNKLNPWVAQETSRIVKVLFFAGAITAGYIVGITNTSLVAFSENFYGNAYLVEISALMIVIGIFGLVQQLYEVTGKANAVLRPVEWVGRKTIFFLGIHGMTIPLSQIILTALGLEATWYMLSIVTFVLDTVAILAYQLTLGRLWTRKSQGI